MIFIVIISQVSFGALNDAKMYYSFDSSSNIGQDISGNGFDGTLHNIYSSTTAKLNLSADMSDGGNANYIETGISYTDIGQEFSIGGWFYLNSLPHNVHLVYNNDGTPHIYILSSNGQMGVVVYGTTNSISDGSVVTGISTGTWHHFTITYNNYVLKTYFDGQLKHTINQDIGEVKHFSNMWFGIYIDSSGNKMEGFPGYFDEFFVYNRELSASEISTLYNNGDGYNPYANQITNLTIINITNEYNSTQQVWKYTAKLNRTGFNWNKNTIDGTLTLPILSNDTKNYTLTIITNTTENNYYYNKSLVISGTNTTLKIKLQEFMRIYVKDNFTHLDFPNASVQTCSGQVKQGLLVQANGTNLIRHNNFYYLPYLNKRNLTVNHSESYTSFKKEINLQQNYTVNLTSGYLYINPIVIYKNYNITNYTLSITKEPYSNSTACDDYTRDYMSSGSNSTYNFTITDTSLEILPIMFGNYSIIIKGLQQIHNNQTIEPPQQTFNYIEYPKTQQSTHTTQQPEMFEVTNYLTAINSSNNATICGVNGNFTNQHYGFTISATETGCLMSLYLLTGNYTGYVTKDGYTQENINFTATHDSNHTIYLFKEFELWLYFFDEDSLQPINNLSISLTKEGYGYNHSVENTSFKIVMNSSGKYKLITEKNDYKTRDLDFELSSKSNAIIYVYMINESETSLISITLNDVYGQSLANYYIDIYRFYPADGVYRLVTSQKTNSEGKAYFYLNTDSIYYKIYARKTLTSAPVQLQSSQILHSTTLTLVYVESGTTQDSFDTYYNLYHLLNYTNTSDSLVWSFTYQDTTNILKSACLEVYKINNRDESLIQTKCLNASAGTIYSDIINLSKIPHSKARAILYTTTKHSTYIEDVEEFFKNIGRELFGKTGLFVSFFIILTAMFVGLSVNATIGLAGLLIGIIVSSVLGLFYISSVALVGIIVLIFWVMMRK